MPAIFPTALLSLKPRSARAYHGLPFYSFVSFITHGRSELLRVLPVCPCLLSILPVCPRVPVLSTHVRDTPAGVLDTPADTVIWTLCRRSAHHLYHFARVHAHAGHPSERLPPAAVCRRVRDCPLLASCIHAAHGSLPASTRDFACAFGHSTAADGAFRDAVFLGLSGLRSAPPSPRGFAAENALSDSRVTHMGAPKRGLPVDSDIRTWDAPGVDGGPKSRLWLLIDGEP